MSAGRRPSRGLLDTNTFILFAHLPETAPLPDQPLISTVTLAELTVGPLLATSDDERAKRFAHVQEAEANFDPLPFDVGAARAFGRVAATLHRAGRKVSARTYDAMIAAVAIANDLSLFTCNPDDFSGIDELDVVGLPHPDAGIG